MTAAIYITSLEPESGKSLVTLGALEAVATRSSRIGYFRPVISAELPVDPLIEMVRRRYRLAQSYEVSFGVTTADTRGLGENVSSALVHRILAKYEALAEACEIVIVEGTDYTGASAAFEFSLNAEIAAHLGASAVVVTRAHSHRPDQMAGVLAAALVSLSERHIPVLGFVVNRVPRGEEAEFGHLTSRSDGIPVSLLPEEPALSRPTLGDVARVMDAPVIGGGPDGLSRTVSRVVVAAMTLPHLIDHLTSESLLVVPGDRADVILMAQASRFSTQMPGLAGLLLTGGYVPDDSIMRFIEGLGDSSLPMLLTSKGTFETVDSVSGIHGSLDSGDERRVAIALRLFEDNMDVNSVAERFLGTRSSTVTPVMFERRLIALARADKRHIVLPEGGDDRILTAADRLIRRDVVNLTILGEEHDIAARAEHLGLELSHVNMVDPVTAPQRQQVADVIFQARRAKGITEQMAWDLAEDPSWFGTVMVKLGMADGMVSGAAHTTADTVRPALQIIRTAPGTSVVSSVFLMALEDRVLVYGDCAVVPDPDAEQLADIALSSAHTAKAFGIDPYVALLSYSTGASAAGAEVEKVTRATELVRQRAPDLPVEGPIQYDAAVVPSVAAAKLPQSTVAGLATVLVFPDLNTGNNTYKAVQRTSGAVAIGPILQGLRLPVNDLSRGATVDDIVNTVVITAIQAQHNRAGSA